jgi:hypothetical protein
MGIDLGLVAIHPLADAFAIGWRLNGHDSSVQDHDL